MKTLPARARAEFLKLSPGDRVAMAVTVVVLPFLALIFAFLGMWPMAVITLIVVVPLAVSIIGLADVVRRQSEYAEPPTEE